MPLVEVKGLEKRYRVGEMEVPVLRGIDLEIEEGDFVALRGPSGCGKSAFMNICDASSAPSDGSINPAGPGL